MNMIGLYYLPIMSMAHEVGTLNDTEVRAALAALEAERFAFYDEQEELVFVPTAALHQVGDELDAKDTARRASRRPTSTAT